MQNTTQHKRILCNKVKCALQYTVDLINNNINRHVQEECANRLVLVQNAIKYNKYQSVLKMKNGQKCPSLVCSTVNTVAYCQYYDPFHPVKTVSADSKSCCFHSASDEYMKIWKDYNILMFLRKKEKSLLLTKSAFI